MTLYLQNVINDKNGMKIVEIEDGLLEYLYKEDPYVADDIVLDDDKLKDDFKDSKAGHFIAGEINADEQGLYHPRKKYIKGRDYVCLDYDKLDEDIYEGVIERLKNKLGQYSWLVYPTLSFNKYAPSFRLIVKLNRLANEEEYKATAIAITKLIGYSKKAHDPNSVSIAQRQGLPMRVKSFTDYDDYRVLNQGEDFPVVDVKENNKPTQKNNTTLPTNLPHNEEQLLSMFYDYLELDKDNLNTEDDEETYNKALSLILSIAKEFKYNRIDLTTAKTLVILTAYGNDKWEKENITKFNHAIKQGEEYFKDTYDLLAKFRAAVKTSSDSPTKEKLKDKLNYYKNILKKDSNIIRDQVSGEYLEIPKDKDGDIILLPHVFPSMIRSVVPIYYDDFSKNIKVDLGWGDVVLDKDEEAIILERVSETYGINIPFQDRENSFISAGYKNKVNKLKELLKRTEWDGIPRVEELFIDALGADDNIYTREITKKILLASVYRALHGGQKFDISVILAGSQGIGKSTLLRRLATSDFYLSITDKITKEALQDTQGKWIVELEELATMEETRTKKMKAWISAENDDFRVVYTKKTKKHPRKFIIFGTTNEPEFLIDWSGNRRYFVMNCDEDKVINSVHDLSKNYWEQIRAELYEMYNNGEAFRPSKELEEYINKANIEYLEKDLVDVNILKLLEMKYPSNYIELLEVTDGTDKHKNFMNYIKGMLKHGKSNIFKTVDKVPLTEFTANDIYYMLFKTNNHHDLSQDKVRKKVSEIMSGLSEWKYNKNYTRGRGYIRKNS